MSPAVGTPVTTLAASSQMTLSARKFWSPLYSRAILLQNYRRELGSASGPAVAALLALLGWALSVRRARTATGETKTVNMAALVGSR